jgi:ABC-type amino acid transport substrate-binding protein
MGIPAGYDAVLPTSPYYRSSYVFVSRADRHLAVRSFDDPALARLTIGVHMMGDDYANSPAVVALGRRGLVDRVVPFMIYGNYSEPNPPARLIDAVRDGTIDIAVAWGPLAGYGARKSPVPLRVVPVRPTGADSALGFTWAIAVGVRRGDSTRRAALDAELARRRADIRKVLEAYGVPLVDGGTLGGAEP